MIFNFSHGSFARVFGIEVFGDAYDKWYWHAFIWPIYRIGSRIRDGVWWIRYRIDPRHKYHLIDTRLKPGYYDIDTLMLNGMFSLLSRYVEDEHEGVESLEKWGQKLLAGGDNDFCREANERQGRKELEAVALYRWWMEVRPAMLNRQDELLDLLYMDRENLFDTEEEEINGQKLYKVIRRRERTVEEIAWSDELQALEEKIANEEQEMLHRLIEIRGGLWT